MAKTKMTFEKYPIQVNIENIIKLIPDSMPNKTLYVDTKHQGIVKMMNLDMPVVFRDGLGDKVFTTDGLKFGKN